MYKKFFLTLLVISLSLVSCKHIRGSGNIIERRVAISGISAIDLSGIGTVTVQIGKEENLIIRGDDNIIEKIDVEAQSRTLKLGKMKDTFTSVSPSGKIEYFLTLTRLEKLTVSGSGKIKVEDKVNADDFRVSISGSGKIYLEDLRADNLSVNISGSGNCDAGGVVERQKIKISGSGKYKAGELESETAICDISGSGRVEIRVSDYLEADISGSGDVYYWGRPRLSLDASGSGNVKNRGD